MGLTIAVCALLSAGIGFPCFLSEKLKQTQMPRSDRYSGRQRVLDTAALAYRGVHATGGGEIHPGHKGRVIVQDSLTQSRLGALAEERARYAATITRRAAAAKRRLALSVALTLLAFVLAGCAAASLIAWGWVGLPVAALVVTLTLGARATKVGRDNDAIMEARIERLRHEARSGQRQSRDLADSKALGEAALASARDAIRSRRASERTEADTTAENPVEAGETTAAASSARPEVESVEAEASDSVAPAPARPVRVTALREAPAGAAAKTDPFATPLTPMPLPRVAVPLRPLIQSSDIDTKELLRQQRSEVAARVPFRPTRVHTPAHGALTSDEVAAAGPVRFNVDDVLEHRRAVGD